MVQDCPRCCYARFRATGLGPDPYQRFPIPPRHYLPDPEPEPVPEEEPPTAQDDGALNPASGEARRPSMALVPTDPVRQLRLLIAPFDQLAPPPYPNVEEAKAFFDSLFTAVYPTEEQLEALEHLSPEVQEFILEVCAKRVNAFFEARANFLKLVEE